MSRVFKFKFLNGEELDRPMDISELCKFPESIRNEIFANDQYKVRSNVQKRCFEQFLNHFLDNKVELEINVNNIFQINFLNKEFGIQLDLTSNPEYKSALNISMINDIKLKHDKSKNEKYISQNLDYFLTNYANEMYQIPINSLYNIFNSPERKLEDHNLAYKFITNQSNANGSKHKSKIYILLSSLDGKKLSFENREDCISKLNNHLSFLPSNMTAKDINSIRDRSSIEKMSEIPSTKTTITLPSGLVIIPPYSFSNRNLVEVVIPISVVSIGSFSFYECSSLSKVTIPPSVLSIEVSSFSGCSSLSNVSIPSSVAWIGERAFSGCSSLKEIVIPSSVTVVGNNAFSNCLQLESVDASAESIGDYAFQWCSALKHVKLGDAVRKIGNYAFNLCTSLKQVSIPPSMTEICDGTFSGCQSLEKVAFPPSLKSIGCNAFYDCTELVDFALPQSLESISKAAFCNCSKIDKVKLPPSLKELGNGAFNRCNKLSSLTVLTPNVKITGSHFESCPISTVKVPSSVPKKSISFKSVKIVDI